MNGIPKVRPWIVHTEDPETQERARWIVWAPTRRLAILNFRHAIGYRLVIDTLGATRKDYGPCPRGLVQPA